MKNKFTTLALMIGASSPAWAEHDLFQLPATRITAAEAPLTGIVLDEAIQTGSRLGLTARQTPASVSVADRAIIEARGAEDTQDVVNTLTGVNASANPGLGGFVSYRGFSAGQITQLYNGIGMSYTAAARPVDAWIYDRVELIGGPSTFLYGAGAVGGSINYITKLASREEQAVQARLRYASHDTSEVALGVNHALGDGPDPRHFARLDISRTASNGYMDRNRREATSTAFSLLSDLTPRLSHTLALEYLEEQEHSPYWGSPILNPVGGTMKIDKRRRFDNYNVADGRYEQRVHWLRSIIDYQLDDATSLHNTLYQYAGQRDYRNIENYRYNADNSQLSRYSAFLQRHDQQVNGNRFEVRHDNSLFGLHSQWTGGLDFSFNQQRLYPGSAFADLPYDTQDPDHFDPGEFGEIPGVNRGLHKGRKNEVTTWAGFLENRLELTERLSLLSGLRYDHLSLEVTHYGTVTPSNPAYFKETWQPLTGRLGLVYELTPAANLYVQYSTAADPPAGSLATATASSLQHARLSTGEQFEIGAKFDFLDGRGAATLAAYQIVRKDFSVADPDNPNSTLQAGRQTSRGLELAGRLNVTPVLALEGNYAYVDARYDDFIEIVAGQPVSRRGNTPTNVPDQVANLWMTYDLDPAWQVGLDTRYVDTVYANTANSLKAPAYTLYGAFARFKVDRHTAITARVRNLTDEIYARQAYGAMFYQGAPRTFELAVDTRF
ncbi:TonB-dependent receptor [Pseudomonas sp. GD03860]|uniref:TonB-dependent receptor n=1 Tax=Pseudomonas TaxID=286 RepID=UPI0023633A4D|nr:MULTISPECIES: TonB-dependent receptor [Pseudomonas]MDD2058585.1 TonB-dependent receptor [Pseudomonas putida]MDH0639550.1 TonB-dependent receptor [Pseudomonas sp. GD03860]